MAILEVLKFPDQRLRNVGKEVAAVSADLQILAKNMLETMYAEHGIGLAAPQVGESIRLVVIDTRPRDLGGRYKDQDPEEVKQTELELKVEQPLVLFNPKLVIGKGKTIYSEGCLSVPTFYEDVERFNEVEVSALDIHGKSICIKTDGLLAICIQHEMDHLDGKLFIDRISFAKSDKIKNRIKKFGYPEKKKGDDSHEEL